MAHGFPRVSAFDVVPLQEFVVVCGSLGFRVQASAFLSPEGVCDGSSSTAIWNAREIGSFPT